MAASGGQDSLARFGAAEGLDASSRLELPASASVARYSGVAVEAAVTGLLPGGLDGSVAHLTWTETEDDSDSPSSERRLTVVVASIPESIGFVPYLSFERSHSRLVERRLGPGRRSVDLRGDPLLARSSAYVYSGTERNWEEQLFSPGLVDRLSRCPPDFGFELSDGSFLAGRDGHLSGEDDLRSLCEDAAFIADAIGRECTEEIGQGTGSAAVDPDAADPWMEDALARAGLPRQSRLGEGDAAMRAFLRTSPGVIRRSLRAALLAALLVNLAGLAIPIVLVIEGDYLVLAAFEFLVVAVSHALLYRRALRQGSKRYAAEAFYRAYAADRGLRPEDPLRFAAAHAGAKLPFRPERVLAGPLPGGGEGALALKGDGSARSDRVAVVLGPEGPIAEAELVAEPLGLTASAIDAYRGHLAAEARGHRARG